MFLVKNNDLIVLAADTREELQEKLKFMVYDSIVETDVDYQLYNGEYLTQSEVAQKERERLDTLCLTRADVERAIYQARGMDFDDVLDFVEQWIAARQGARNDGAEESESTTSHCEEAQADAVIHSQEAETNETDNIDLKALKIELKANNFYRGNPYINKIGQILGFTSTQLDEFFETGNWEKLIGQSDELSDEIPF